MTLAACAPTQSTGGLGSTGATALKVPHLTLSGLTVIVHNPADGTLTGDTTRKQGPEVTVDGVDIKPGVGEMCLPDPGVTKDISWICTSKDVEPGGTDDLVFLANGPAPSIKDAQGFGYLGNGVPVPLALIR
ncbi:hypothetical protein E7T09_04085 [Deinococcus sp. KSM4-11]|uniref:hypothetical protein n=1 Tax=Deinococcus sp. KSM4-11 TaxID=2568654 RepID=UPI0010A3E48B|nr:hypothetical protein [Deinococcus sp. KSM4-11]THF88393.1 hypothetical protein E7T09_04085 [Deinococcus sp. KSM4-11]